VPPPGTPRGWGVSGAALIEEPVLGIGESGVGVGARWGCHRGCRCRGLHAADLGLQTIVAGQACLGFGDLAADLDVARQRVEKVVARPATRLGVGGAGERDGRDAEKK
jgi:hypothetical protein